MWLLAILGILDIFINAEQALLAAVFPLYCFMAHSSLLQFYEYQPYPYYRQPALTAGSRLNPDYLCKSADQE